MSKSARLRLTDIRRVFQLLGEMRELRHDPVARDEHMVLGLCRMFGARQGAALRLGGFTAEGIIQLRGMVGAGWVDLALAKTWEEMLANGSPRDDILADRASGFTRKFFAGRRQDIVPDAEWDGSHDPRIQWVKQTRICAHLVMLHRLDDPAEVRAITLHRTDGEPNFTPHDQTVLRLFNAELYLAHARGDFHPPAPAAPRLTPRQRQVLDRLLAGDSVKQAAAHLSIHPQTAADHVQRLYQLFHVSTRAELLARFIQPGLSVGNSNDEIRIPESNSKDE